ncbi:MAG: hypothetical protein ACLUI3_03420 [Christensenellales bacterium]
MQHSNLPATIMVPDTANAGAEFALGGAAVHFAGNLLNCGGTTDRLAKFAGILTGRARRLSQTSVGCPR